MKSTFHASSDVALIKYWGKKDDVLRLPANGSISMITEGLDTTTTVAFQRELTQDKVTIAGVQNPKEVKRVVGHLDRIRTYAQSNLYARVESVNAFPKGTGLSSSGSGFAALTYAATTALGLDLSQRELSILARQASGTACRCVCGGLVEWRNGNTSGTSYSETIYPHDYWELHDVVAIVDEGMKQVSSTEGHMTAHSSPFFPIRQQKIEDKIQALKSAIGARNLTRFGELVEAEALEFHTILLTSQPPLIAWYPGTIEVMHKVQQMRKAGIEAYFTINTGFNVHVLTTPTDVGSVKRALQELSLVKRCIHVQIGDKPKSLDEHLF
ncbi:diphosphomevalonate decarboxylase [Chloroflexi bacterium TSY]|nr:diphosphomevalonate decarboxylase [Chloroflexi bacterium TSY]